MSQDPARDSSIDVEKGGIETKPTLNGRYKPTADDDACFKLWNTYIEQAQDYDYKLLEGWKGDMDGMLLFSALYSATLTALIVESYQKLQQDPADATLAVLTQVSRQLASLSDGTTAPFQDLPAFDLEPSVLICNMLWFLSLALALTCSLLATFVQQWVRDFLHKTTIRPSPVVQARVLAFSYFGLRRFGLHTFVDIILILLHLSLFLFFAGLVAFLLPINRPLMYLLAGVLIVFMLVYTGLSCMPLVWLDAPYRTPVSDLLWRVGNRLRGFFFRAHKLPEDLSLTEAMVETSLKDSSERDRQCMRYTLKSLNHDTELLPMLGAISEAILGPTGTRFDNVTLIVPLLRAPDPEENIVSRISHFVSVSGTSTDPTQQENEKQISLKALWSSVHLVVEHSPQKPVISDPPVFWFKRDRLDELAKSSFASDFRMISALALIRTSRLQSLRRCIDTVAEKLSSSLDQLRLAKDTFDNVTLEDVDWTSTLFMTQFSELRNVLREGCLPDLSESRAHELVQQANALVQGLQSPGRWKAAIISVLSGFLSDAAKTEQVPFEVNLTHHLICSSIPGVNVFDQSLEVEDDEAEASLLLQITSPYPSSVLPELFIHILRLAFSTKRALVSQRCRGVALEYYYNSCHTVKQGTGYLPYLDTAGNLGHCLLQDFRDNHLSFVNNVVLIRSLYIAMGVYSNRIVSLRLHSFAKQIFDFIPTASTKFTQDHWWNPSKSYTEWVLCKDILVKLDSLTMGYECLSDNSDLSPSNSQTLDDICCLGGRLLPDVPVPTHPSPCTANEHKQWGQEIQTYVMSMNLLILSKFVDLTAEDTGGILTGDWVGMQMKLLHYSGHVYDTIQLKFAKSVQRLVYLTPWNQQKDTPAFRAFHERIWRLSAHNWCWITDVESARILLEAIERHINDGNYRGWIWVERELFNHCTQIIQEAESK
ncbi:hypothetical protein VKT23_007302 [Stygiomarasmius scandens]|uniref:DUF6535 domain-containing protein n=1 Tax=Marasmiellus scandens TaxID=2682957 RepID=A0ABR1JKP7_9AGAR